MSPTSTRITDTVARERPLAAWLSGMAVAMLAMGATGAMQPLLPPFFESAPASEESVALQDFQLPAAAAASPATEAFQEQVPASEVIIPPLPAITPPLTPPEVPEPVKMETLPPVPEKKDVTVEHKPVEKPALRQAASNISAPSNASSTDSPTLFSGGAGRFPQPSYPAAARAAKLQGAVRLVVTVEESGQPSLVEVQTSSGFSLLDNAASDHIRRRWRWPAGPVRRFLVPVRFQLR